MYDYPMHAIFFDADGILCRHGNRQAHLRGFLAGYGLALPAWEQLREVISASIHQAITGTITRDALYDAILAACGLSQPDVIERGREAMAADDANISLCDDVPETLGALRARGLRLGVITNSASSAEEKRSWLRACGLDIRWDCFISSCDVGMRKPDLEIYQFALARCGEAASDADFVGHSASELQGAREAGLTTIAINPDTGAQADIMLSRFADLLHLSFFE
jgi:HAD superfamily hydrolase (TIGR01509 family)